MANLFTLADIKSQCAGEWVLLGSPQLGQSSEVVAGTVLFHSKDRDEVYRQAIALHPSRFAVLYTGTMPEGTAIVLCTANSFLPAGRKAFEYNGLVGSDAQV